MRFFSGSLVNVSSFVLILSAFLLDANAVQSTGRATQRVIAALRLQNMSDLNFGVGIQGDPAKTVPPGNSETPENASFFVSGEPNAQVTVSLPGSDIFMVHRTDGRSKIKVYDFRSNVGREVVLDQNGKSFIFVGATREALNPALPRGDYEGSFTVDVVYQ